MAEKCVTQRSQIESPVCADCGRALRSDHQYVIFQGRPVCASLEGCQRRQKQGTAGRVHCERCGAPFSYSKAYKVVAGETVCRDERACRRRARVMVAGGAA